jgi:hypothetical protein
MTPKVRNRSACACQSRKTHIPTRPFPRRASPGGEASSCALGSRANSSPRSC